MQGGERARGVTLPSFRSGLNAPVVTKDQEETPKKEAAVSDPVSGPRRARYA